MSTTQAPKAPRTGGTPLHEHVPYWNTATIALRDGKKLPVVVLKDGSMAVGLNIHGLDVYGSDNEELDRHAQRITEALNSLPEGAYLQAVFESGLSFAPLIEKFSKQTTGAFPFFAVGRAVQTANFRQCPSITRCAITYWLGLHQILAFLEGAQLPLFDRILRRVRLSGTVRMTDTERVRKAAHLLQDAMDGFTRHLRGMGMGFELLDEAQIVAACHRSINPLTKLPAPLYVETDQDIEDYKAGKPLLLRGETLAEQLSIGNFQSNDITMTRGNPPILMRALGVSALANDTTAKALHDAMYTHMPEQPFRIVVTHRATANRFGSKQAFTRRVLFVQKFASGINADAAKALEQNLAVLEELADRPARIFKTTVVVIAMGRNEQELEKASQEVFAGFQAQNIQVDPYEHDQHLAWLATMPAAVPHPALRTHTLLDYSAAHLTPYWLPSTGSAVPDLLVENYQRGIEGLSVRRSADRPTASAILSGGTGAGKTVLAIAIAKYGIVDQGGHLFVVDNKGYHNSSWRPVTEQVGGTWIACHNNANIAISPLPSRQDLLDAERAARENPQDVFDPLEPAQRMVRIMGGMSGTFDGTNGAADQEAEFARTVLSTVIPRVYERNPLSREVLLEDVVTALNQYRDPDETRMTVAKTLHSRLGNWITPRERADLFNRPTNVSLDDPWTVFDFHGIDTDGGMGAVLICALGSRIEAKLRKLSKAIPKAFVWDEAWALADYCVDAVRLQGRLARVGRSLGAFNYFVTHKISDIANNRAGKGAEGILALTQMYYFLKYDEVQALHDAAEALNLTPRQRELFASLESEPGRYSDCLRIDTAQKRTHVFSYWPTPFDLWCDTSRPEDVELRAAEQKKTGKPFLEVVADLAARYPNGAPAKPKNTAQVSP